MCPFRTSPTQKAYRINILQLLNAIKPSICFRMVTKPSSNLLRRKRATYKEMETLTAIFTTSKITWEMSVQRFKGKQLPPVPSYKRTIIIRLENVEVLV